MSAYIYGPTKRRCGAAKFSKRGPTKSSAARENPGFLDADYAWRGFLRHVTLLAIVIGHRATSCEK